MWYTAPATRGGGVGGWVGAGPPRAVRTPSGRPTCPRPPPSPPPSTPRAPCLSPRWRLRGGGWGGLPKNCKNFALKMRPSWTGMVLLGFLGHPCNWRPGPLVNPESPQLIVGPWLLHMRRFNATHKIFLQRLFKRIEINHILICWTGICVRLSEFRIFFVANLSAKLLRAKFCIPEKGSLPTALAIPYSPSPKVCT